jgi:transposase
MATLFGVFPFLKTLTADIKGPNLRLQKFCCISTLKSSNAPDRVNGFAVSPKRWIVEHTIAWLNRCRRLAKDWENLN